jgi:hypothetical protein
MAARGTRPRPADRPHPPDEHAWVESDAYDRSAFARCSRRRHRSRSSRTTAARSSAFRIAAADVFCLLFKLEPRFRDGAEVAPAAALNRTLLDAFRDHPLLEHLREQTQLDETQAGSARC